jgi:hypothetical protein
MKFFGDEKRAQLVRSVLMNINHKAPCAQPYLEGEHLAKMPWCARWNISRHYNRYKPSSIGWSLNQEIGWAKGLIVAVTCLSLGFTVNADPAITHRVDAAPLPTQVGSSLGTFPVAVTSTFDGDSIKGNASGEFDLPFAQ